MSWGPARRARPDGTCTRPAPRYPAGTRPDGEEGFAAEQPVGAEGVRGRVHRRRAFGVFPALQDAHGQVHVAGGEVGDEALPVEGMDGVVDRIEEGAGGDEGHVVADQEREHVAPALRGGQEVAVARLRKGEDVAGGAREDNIGMSASEAE